MISLQTVVEDFMVHMLRSLRVQTMDLICTKNISNGCPANWVETIVVYSAKTINLALLNSFELVGNFDPNAPPGR